MTGIIFTIAQQKGGAGKTTVAAHLAVAWSRRGERSVAILDIDPQGSLGEWLEKRERRLGEDATGFAFRTASSWGARREAQRLARDHDVVLIDTPANAEREARPVALLTTAPNHLDAPIAVSRPRISIEIRNSQVLCAVYTEYSIRAKYIVFVEPYSMHLALNAALKRELNNGVRRNRVSRIRLTPGIVVKPDRCASIENREVTIFVLRPKGRCRNRRKVDAIRADRRSSLVHTNIRERAIGTYSSIVIGRNDQVEAATSEVLAYGYRKRLRPRPRISIEIRNSQVLCAVYTEYSIRAKYIIFVKPYSMHLTLNAALKRELNNGVRRNRVSRIRLTPGIVVKPDRCASIENREVTIPVLIRK